MHLLVHITFTCAYDEVEVITKNILYVYAQCGEKLREVFISFSTLTKMEREGYVHTLATMYARGLL